MSCLLMVDRWQSDTCAIPVILGYYRSAMAANIDRRKILAARRDFLERKLIDRGRDPIAILLTREQLLSRIELEYPKPYIKKVAEYPNLTITDVYPDAVEEIVPLEQPLERHAAPCPTCGTEIEYDPDYLNGLYVTWCASCLWSGYVSELLSSETV